MKNNKLKKDIELLETIEKNGMIWLVLGSLISADSLMTVEECDKNLEICTSFLEAAEKANLKEKEKIIKYLKDGVEIIKRDKEELLKNK